MRILFNLCNVGLAKNGGSNTLIYSANTLQELGHEVSIIDTHQNPKTWVKIKCNHIIVKTEKDIPNADVVVATGYKSFAHSIKLPKRCGVKFVYLRGWELWQTSEESLVRILKTNDMIKIVNSIGLKNKLNSYKIKTHLIRPGNDFNNFIDLEKRFKNKDIVLGALYHTKHKTKRSDWAIKVKQKLSKKYKNVKLYMFGADKNPNNPNIDFYIQEPNIKQKNELFNNVNIWLSPSNLEGLHVVPQEALLTNCPCITTEAELSGTIDYVTHEENGMITKDNFNDFLYNVEYLIENKKILKEMSIEDNCRNSIIRLGDRKNNMRKFVDILNIYMVR